MSLSQTAVARAADCFQARWIILAVVLLADVIDLLDASITNIAAPTIAGNLGGGPALVQWLGASYALSMGVLLVPGGRLGDKYGRRRMFMIGVTGFTLASIACGLALSPATIIVARLAQGAFGALLIPQGFGIIGAVFPREQLGQAFSAFGPIMGLAAVCGPILAGALINADIAGFGWRAIFLINLFFGAVALVVAWVYLPRDEGDRTVHIDLPGATLLCGAMLTALFSLIEGAASGWPPFTLAAGAVGLLLFALFWRQQRTTDDPLLLPSLFRNRGFTAGLIVGVAFFAAIAGLMLVVGLYVQYGLGYSPLEAALTMAPVAGGIAVASLIAARLIARRGRALIYGGLLFTLAGVGGLLLHFRLPETMSGPWSLLLPLLIVGLGVGSAFGAIFDVALGDTDPSEAGSASGSLSAVQQLAAAAGAAAVTTVYFQRAPLVGQALAAQASLIAVAGMLLFAILLVRQMPRRTRSEE
jgi:EmrB/QacA subfamily drug resistance transporter